MHQAAQGHVALAIPEPVYAMFRLTFAIIAAALMVGVFGERMRFSAERCDPNAPRYVKGLR